MEPTSGGASLHRQAGCERRWGLPMRRREFHHSARRRSGVAVRGARAAERVRRLGALMPYAASDENLGIVEAPPGRGSRHCADAH